MTITVNATDELEMELFTDDEAKDIAQNIQCILRTLCGTCPNLRGYGIDPAIMHKPITIAKAAYTVSLSNQLTKYEPRVALKKISFADDPDNPDVLNPIVEVIAP